MARLGLPFLAVVLFVTGCERYDPAEESRFKAINGCPFRCCGYYQTWEAKVATPLYRQPGAPADLSTRFFGLMQPGHTAEVRQGFVEGRAGVCRVLID
jgi:hypothetical protein